jgi:IS5 family transposase
MIATPVFGYKSHISIDRRYGFIRAAAVTSASHPDGRMLRQVIDRENTGSEVWADSACRSQSNEAWLADRMLTSRIHRRKPKGKSMPIATARANAAKSAIRAKVEHVFAHQNVWSAPVQAMVFNGVSSLHKRIRHVSTLAAAKMEIRAPRSS